jgi:DNA-binding transcriptional regulator YiaG
MNGLDLKLARVKAGVKANALADQLGVDKSTVSRWEAAIFISQDQIDRYLAALATCSTFRNAGGKAAA